MKIIAACKAIEDQFLVQVIENNRFQIDMMPGRSIQKISADSWKADCANRIDEIQHFFAGDQSFFLILRELQFLPAVPAATSHDTSDFLASLRKLTLELISSMYLQKSFSVQASPSIRSSEISSLPR